MNAVVEQIKMVSIKTEIVCTNPCLTGCDTSAVAPALGAETFLASFENSPPLMHNTKFHKTTVNSLGIKSLTKDVSKDGG